MPFKQNFSQKVVAVVQGINHLQPSGWFSQCPLLELHSEAAPLESVSEFPGSNCPYDNLPANSTWTVSQAGLCLSSRVITSSWRFSKPNFFPTCRWPNLRKQHWVVDAKWGGNFSLLLCGDQHLLADLSNLLSFHFLSVVIKMPYPYSIFHS